MDTKYSVIPEGKGIITEKLLRNFEVNETHSHEESVNNDLIIAKVTAILVLGLVSFALGLLPIKLAKWFKWKMRSPDNTGNNLVISLLLCFGGGVLMFTTFLHLQPEVREEIDLLIKTGDIPEFGHDANIADLIFCMGFFFVYLIEEIVHGVLDRKHDHNEEEAFLHRTMSLRRCSRRTASQNDDGNPTLIPRVSLNHPTDAKSLEPNTKSTSTQVLLDSSSVSTIHDTNTTHSTFIEPEYSSKFSPLDPEAQMTGGPLSIYSHYSKNNEKNEEDSSRKDYFNNFRKPEEKEKYFTTMEKSSSSSSNHHSHILYDDDSNSSASDDSNKLGKSFRGFFTILALSFHAVFEGLAVGLENEVANVWYLFLAVATHKFVISFCVGVELLTTRTKMFLIVVYLSTFAIVSPLGIGVGIALSGDAESSRGDLTTVILQGMAAGTLLYVVFFEVLQRERANSQSGVLQLMAIMAGFGVMFALQVITGHEHHHEHVESLPTALHPHHHDDAHHHH